MRRKAMLLACLVSIFAITTSHAQTGQPTSTASSAATPITVTVDATDAPRKMLHAHLTIPVQPGDVTLLILSGFPASMNRAALSTIWQVW